MPLRNNSLTHSLTPDWGANLRRSVPTYRKQQCIRGTSRRCAIQIYIYFTTLLYFMTEAHYVRTTGPGLLHNNEMAESRKCNLLIANPMPSPVHHHNATTVQQEAYCHNTLRKCRCAKFSATFSQLRASCTKSSSSGKFLRISSASQPN